MPSLPKTKAELHAPAAKPSISTPTKKARPKTTGRAVGKEKLARVLATRLKVSTRQATQFIEMYVQTTTALLSAGDRLVLRDFGTLEVRQRAARQNRHPQTGKTSIVPAQRTVAFKPSQQLKKVIDKQ